MTNRLSARKKFYYRNTDQMRSLREFLDMEHKEAQLIQELREQGFFGQQENTLEDELLAEGREA